MFALHFAAEVWRSFGDKGLGLGLCVLVLTVMRVFEFLGFRGLGLVVLAAEVV